MKNIAIIIPSLTGGGAERAAGRLSMLLSQYYNVYIFVVEEKPITYQYRGELVNIGFTSEYNKLKKTFSFLGGLFSKYAYIYAVKRIRQLKKKYNISATISFSETSNLFNLFSKERDKVYVSVRSTRSLQNASKIERIQNLGIKLFYNKADRVIATSYGVQDDLINNFGIEPHRIKTIYNVYDFDVIKGSMKKPLPEHIASFIKNKTVICTMGRLIPSKNQLWLIDVCHQLFQTMDNTVLLIIGDGELKQNITERIETLAEKNRMMLIEFQPNPFPIINRAEVFVMATEREGFCNSIIEAMACGTPVISTDCKCSPREIIADMKEYSTTLEKCLYTSRGVLVPIGNEKEMLRAMERVLTDKIYRDKIKNNQKNYIECFSNDSIEKQWIELIEGQF